MSKFQVGNCVRATRSYCDSISKKWSSGKGSRANDIYYGSYHILTNKDVARGYYFCNNAIIHMPSIDLNHAEFVRPSMHYRNRDQSLRGKYIQPTRSMRTSSTWVSCYISFRGMSTEIQGFLNEDKNMVHFCDGRQSYKAKVYIDEDGFVRGLTKYTPLGSKQKRNSTRFIEGEIVNG